MLPWLVQFRLLCPRLGVLCSCSGLFHSRLGLPNLRIQARRVRDGNSFYLAFITNLNWHRIGWLLRRDYTILVKGNIHRTDLSTKAMSALWGVHLTAGVNSLMINGRSVASEFFGFRRGSASKKTRHKPDTAKRASTLPPLGATGAGWRGCGAIGANMARMSRDLENAESAKPVFDSHQSTGILFLNEIGF
jgi:hypothetical protein